MINPEAMTSGPMRRSLCLLSNAYPDFSDSNRVVFIRTLAELLARDGWEVSVVAPRIFSGSRPREREDSIEVRRFHSFMRGRLLLEYERTPIFRLAGYMAAGFLAAMACVRERKCSLIHAHWVIPAGLLAVIVGGLCGKPVVVTAHGSYILVIPQRNFLARWLVRFVLKRADAVISVAEHLTEEIMRAGVSQDKLVTVPMSVPTELFRPDGHAPEEWAGKTVIFSNRSLYPLYNVELLIKAAPAILSRIPDAVICIAGEGPEEKRLVSLARELGVSERVIFLGAIPHRRMPEYLRGASIYVSTALSDGASVSLLEAMACGTFPIVADIPANQEWIEDGRNWYLFPSEDADALAEKIAACVGRPELRSSARDINTGIVEQRARWSVNVQKLLGLYEKVTTRR